MAGRHVVHNAGVDPFSKKSQPFAAAVLLEVAGDGEAFCRQERVSRSEAPNEGFVFVGGGTAQTVVHMEDDERPLVHLAESEQQEDAVGASGNRDAELGTGEAEPSERSCNLRQHTIR